MRRNTSRPAGGVWRWVLPAAIGILFAAIVACCPQAARAATLTCGPQPEIVPANLTERVDSDAKARSNLILQARPDTSLRRFITAQRNEMRQRFPEVEPLLVIRYLLWATCQAISNDPTQTGSQKFDRYADVYRLLHEPVTNAPEAE